jgi:hypothetical protein
LAGGRSDWEYEELGVGSREPEIRVGSQKSGARSQEPGGLYSWGFGSCPFQAAVKLIIQPQEGEVFEFARQYRVPILSKQL